MEDKDINSFEVEFYSKEDYKIESYLEYPIKYDKKKNIFILRNENNKIIYKGDIIDDCSEWLLKQLEPKYPNYILTIIKYYSSIDK